ncbi:MAG: AsmA-like C-terminal region-containing protein, partial [Planctomycetia bacterium]|nr:AsmA-like C-terminal region-containing protein [Planctomycetia bacterium]
LTADARKFMLERQLVDLLPPTWQQIWYQYLPAGEVNLRFSLDFDGQRWTPKLDAQCVDVSFSHHKFPYRLERASGNLAFADNKLALRLRAFGDGRPVDIDGQIEHPGPASTGVVTINTTELPVSSRLMDALPGKSQTVVRSLAPQGTINAQVRVSRQVATDKWHQQIAVDLNRIAIRYEKFAYPLKDVRGRLEGVDGQWTFRDLVGTNDTGYVTCSGQFVPSPGGGELTLRFDGTDVPLGEELRGALSPRLQDFWLRLKPRGSVNLTSQLRYASPAKTLDVTVHIEPCNDSVSLEPDFFPYQLAKLSGAIDYHNGLVELHRVGAEHGRTQVVTDGHCRVGPDGGWDLRLENFTVDRLLPERELLAALPPRLRKGIAELNFDGPLNLRGNWALSRGGRPEDPLLSQWDVEFSTLQGRLHAGIELKNLAGGVRLIGQFDGTKQQMRGWLDIDSAMYGDYQLTHIRGPMWLSDDQFLLGAWAEPSNPGTAPNRLTAQAYGGVIAADIRVTLGGTPQFNVVAEAERVDLARLITETTRNGTRLQGNVAANIELSGTAAGTHRLSGSGGIRLQNGDIYELPLLVSLLKILSVRPPDKKAFSSSEMNFRIRADHIYFDKINFYGDAISMLGKGEMDFDRNVHMKFHAMVGSDQMHIPILRPVLGLASQQLMQVYVEGPLDHPHTSREALPGVRRVLEEFQGEIEDPHGVAPLMRVGEGGLTPAATPRATGP